MKKLLMSLIIVGFIGCTINFDDANVNYNESTTEEETKTVVVMLPDAPHDFSAVTGNSEITLSWATDANADSYNIYYSTTQGFYNVILENVSSPYTLTGISNDTTYYAVIVAVNSAGESLKSVEIAATPGVIDNLNGTISVITQGLIWAKCSQSNAFGGNSYNPLSNDCSLGVPVTLQHCPTAYTCDNGIELLPGTFSEVYDTCNTLQLDVGGWRVPTTLELEGLHIHYANNQNMWPDIINDYYWPTTAYSVAPYYGYMVISIVNGGYQTVPIAIESFYKYVLCVR